MAGDWEETTLGECAVWLSGGTPFKGNEAFWSGPIPWVSAKDMKSFRLHDAEDHISPLAVGNGGKLVPAGTILLLVRGMTLHNDVPICMITREMAFNQDIKALQPAKNVDGAFLAYWLLANKPELLASVDHAGHGTGRLVTDTLKEKQVLLPPLAEQKAIAAVLGALDDKIELNRRMNATLEALARALFQSWFVDFDPVRAKLDGRQPIGLDPVTASLFPSSFEDSSLGHIPMGWEVVSLDALASIRGGRQLPTEDCLPVGKFKVFGANGIMGYAMESTHVGFVIAFGRVGAYCGSIHWSLDSAWINNNASAVVPLKWPAYVLQAMLNIDFYSMRTGSAQPFIPNSSVASAKVLRPSPEIAEAFCRVVEPLRREQADNDMQSRTLATLRDTLLPKLLSGDLSVAEDEKEVSA